MKTALFAGPTLWQDEIPEGISRYGPVALGSVYRAVEAGYDRIGIVDGYFGNVPAVWHKEILHAIASGVEVSGAASMGALRAAELWQFGMIGQGRIYRMFRYGSLTDDDEVAILHATEEFNLQPLTEAMVNIRATLRRLRLVGQISRNTEQDVAGRMKALHFSERSLEALRHHATEAQGHASALSMMNAYKQHYCDVKRVDGLLLVAWLTQAVQRRPQPARAFNTTRHWRAQFVHQIADVPPLR